jgi:hypothetical protein
MTLPVLDRESYLHSPSDWVLHAGRALQEAGYLHSEPTGLYDEEFAAALTAFQGDRGIHEENQVGPFTWDALGVRDDAAVAGAEGHWEEPAAAPDEHGHVAGADVAAQVGMLSDDGQWRWDGSEWAAVAAHHSAGPSEYEDAELAGAIMDHEIEILFQWKLALDTFDKISMSESDASAQPDFAAALTKLFTEKVIGEVFKKANAELVVDVVKGLIGESERAKSAQKSVAVRDFYTTHQDHIADLHRDLTARRAGFVAAVRIETQRLINNDPDSYGMLRMELMELHQDSLQRLQTATQQELFTELSAEWTSQSKHQISWDAVEAAEIRVRVRDADLSVIDVVINAPDGDKLVEKLSKQPGGMNVWHMKAPKLFIFMDSDEHAVGYVRLDAGNHLANLPAEQDGHYKQRYQRLVANGGVAPVTKG